MGTQSSDTSRKDAFVDPQKVKLMAMFDGSEGQGYLSPNLMNSVWFLENTVEGASQLKS